MRAGMFYRTGPDSGQGRAVASSSGDGGQGRAIARTISARSGHLRYGWYCCVLAALHLLIVACSNGTEATTSKVTPQATKAVTATVLTATSTQGVGAAGCKPASAIMNSAIGLPEIRGTGRGMEVWALLFGDLKARNDQKIVWRLTGEGDPQFTTVGPQGEHARVVFGPTAHGSSNWQRPGDEWGIGFNFQMAGCWDLHVSRGKAVGDVWLIIK
jgi:hypothetical protein